MKKENVKTADRKPEVYTDDKGRKRVRMVSVDRQIVKTDEKSVSKAQQKFFGIVRGLQKGEIDDASPEAKKAAASMSKKDVKDFAKTKHKGLPTFKESLRKDIAKRGKVADALRDYARKLPKHMKDDGNHFKDAAIHIDNGDKGALKKHLKNIDSDPRDGIISIMRKHGMKEKKEISVADYKKKTGKKTVSLKHLTKNTHINPFKESTAAYGSSQDAIANKKKKDAISTSDKDKLSKLADLMRRQRERTQVTGEAVKISPAQQKKIDDRKAKRDADRRSSAARKATPRKSGPSKGTKSSGGDWTADQQKSAKALSFEIGKNDKHDAVHKTLAKAADASHPSLGGRKVKVKINGKSKEMAHKDLQRAVDLHKRLPLGKKAAVMNLIRDKGHDAISAAAKHYKKKYND